MRAIHSKPSLIRSGLAAAVLLVAASASYAQQTINLTAAPTQAVLPDGQTVPMWGYSCGAAATDGTTATCAAANPNAAGNWSPVVITVPYNTSGTSLTINLTNSLSFTAGAGANTVPTSLVIVGQLGGGLGSPPTTTPSPEHAAQGPTWPAAAPPDPGADCKNNRAGAAALGTNCPPPQGPRVQSFATEVAAGVTTGLTWSNLRPGTYLIESGTHPSIQGPMGLYGVLVVTTAPTTTATGVAYNVGTAAAVNYGSEIPLVFSEIDAVQNRSVDTAVKTAGFAETNVWSGQPGKCGDLPPSTTSNSATANTCYPPAVNFDPRYFLINGVSYDQSSAYKSTFATTPAGATGTVLVRLVNAGLRMHVPSIVGSLTGASNASGFSLIAQDGNVLPGVPRVQSEVFMAAGKTYDVLVNDPALNVPALSSLAIYDRHLSLSTNNRRGGGMLAYIARTTLAATTPTASSNGDSYYCVAGTTLNVSDPAKGVLANDPGSNGAVLSATTLPAGSLSFNSNGTFTYTQAPTDTTCGGTITYLVNGLASATAIATITQCDASTPSCTQLAAAPTAGDIQFTSNVNSRFASSPPGVLAGVTAGSATTAVSADAAAAGVTLNADGSFVAAGPGIACPTTGLNPAAPTNATCVTFHYVPKNAQGVGDATAPGTATVIFMPASHLQVHVLDAKGNPLAPEITDYRWIIEEDRTFFSDPKCQVNSLDPALRPASCPPLPVQSLGYNFHTAYMPIVATGCVGEVSCEGGQTLLGAGAVCDIGNGACRTDSSQKTPITPDQVYLDPAKRYYISILPGDGANPTNSGAGGPMQVDPSCDPTATACAMRQFKLSDCTSFAASLTSPGDCGHAMGGASVSGSVVSLGQNVLNVFLQETPLPTAKIAAFVFEDDNPLNGENDAGGPPGAAPAGLAANEPGLGEFNLEVWDQGGGLGDPTGQITYDMFNQPVSNSLAGTIDPFNGNDACPITSNPDRMIGMIPTCPNYESDGVTESALRGQAIIANLYPGLYEIAAHPGADRIGRGEEWVQTNTLDGSPPHEVFIKADEPAYFQEFGPGNFHVVIGFANPKIIDDRRHNTAGTGLCDPAPAGGGLTCTANLFGKVSNARMSRTPDQRIWDSGDYSAYGFTQCYVALGAPDNADFAFAKCDADGNFEMHNLPATMTNIAQTGDYKLTVFDQWNDIMLDGLVLPVHVSTTAGAPGTDADHRIAFPVTQWRTNMYTRTFIDSGNGTVGTAGDGVSQDGEPGLPFAATNIRYRDGSLGFFNNTDLDGYAGFNEVFPFVNWLVLETDTTRFKQTGEHVIYDAGGPADNSPSCNSTNAPCGTATATTGLANTYEKVVLPDALRVPGARYCANADCPPGDTAGGSAGRVDPPQPWGATEGWQGLLGQSSFVEFGMKPFAAGENGGIKGHVIYASTRPFDDPALLLQLSWEPGVPRVTINLYQEVTAPDGSTSLKLADTTKTSSWDDWAQGFRADGATPNMNCPGQDPNSPFFATLQGSPQWLDPQKRALPNNAQFKCYDGWSMMNQVQPAPYDGMYKFPSVTAVDPATGMTTGTNCTVCVPNPDTSDTFRAGTPMLPAGKYVVEVIVPPGMELVKEEDKNILLGDTYVAPVTTQFAGFGNVFIMPDQAAVGSTYNKNNTLNMTTNLNAVPRHEGDTGSIEAFWPCVGALRTVPDYNSLFPAAGQNSPFAGASRRLCDRKEVTLEDQASVLAKFYVFTSTHVAGHFAGVITNDFASEFDPFSPQFGEKFSPPNLPVGVRDFTGKEISRVVSDQWGIYNGLTFSSYAVNPPNPTGYIPSMMVMCMDDPGPIAKTNDQGLYVNAVGTTVATPDLAEQITDPSYNPAYSNFCYETAFMPGFTAYMDTPVIPTQAFADGYNLPDAEYPEMTPAISNVISTAGAGPWVDGTLTYPVASVAVNNRGSYTSVPGITFNPTGAAATAIMQVNALDNSGNHAAAQYSAGTPTLTFALPTCPVAGAPCTRATAHANMGGTPRRVTSISIDNRGNGYTTLPAVTVTCTGGCTLSSGGTALTVATASLRVGSVVVTAGGAYATAPGVTFAAGTTTATGTATLGTPTVTATTGSRLTITALGDKVVQNPDFSGPAATTAPFNEKTITRHYLFGPTAGTVTIGGVNAPVVSWDTNTIVVGVPAGVPNCSVQQRGAPAAACGELEITAADGKKSIDTVTVTIGGKAPTYVTGENADGNALQLAIDAAAPGDLIIVGPGTYKEHVLMWKPVRLQGVAAASVTINADAHPVGILDPWRRQVNCLFGLNLNGTPHDSVVLPGNSAFDPTGQYTCPDSMFLRVDRIDFEAIVGWDATGNGNLAQLLQEPTLMGAYEGAGITVLGRGVRIPTSSTDFWGLQGGAVAGAYPVGSVYLTGSDADCATTTSTGAALPQGRDYGTSNFNCNPSRIDGVSIINSSQGGGAVFIHGWNHNLDVGNTRIFANHGTLTGGINLGNGETPPAYVNDGTLCGPGVVAPGPLCPPLQGTPAGGTIPFGINTRVHVHNNMIINNASVGDALFSGTPSGAGGLTISAGADDYQVDHNWIAGNLSTGDGGGMVHSGLSFRGKINNNWVLFNQSTNPTLPTNGGGIGVIGANGTRTLPDGTECGTATDFDCPPGVGDGTGAGLVIDSNLIIGNSAESGSGGGLRLQQVNGTEVAAFLTQPSQWFDVTVTNNVIVNNVAGWDGAGISLEDTLKARIVNNTIASNDTTSSAGVLFKTLGAVNASSPPPGCNPTTDPTLPQDPNCLLHSITPVAQPAGLVTMQNTPIFVSSLTGNVTCPSGYGYSGGTGTGGLNNANCRALSLPYLANDMFWQNRAFHVEITGMGTGTQSQQNLVSLVPLLNQSTTGACLATGLASDGITPVNTNYWDVGVRGDGLPNDGAGGARVSLSNSILTPYGANNYAGSGNLYPSTSPVLAQYCNGSRVPPENGGHGYQAPAGRSETTGLSPVFVFNNIAPAATVDEGNNWINLSYGPLTLYSDAGKAMLDIAAVGVVNGAYTTVPGSAADGAGNASATGAPNHDFFGQSRPLGCAMDIGAVEIVGSNPCMQVTPQPLPFGAVQVGGTKVLAVTVANTGTSALALAAPTITGSGRTDSAPARYSFTTTCGASVAAGSSCTISVTFAPTATGNQTANLNVNATNTAPQTVLMSGTGVVILSVSPNPVAFGTVTINATKTLAVTVSNAASSPVNLLLAAPTISGSGRTDSQPTKYSFTTNCPLGGAGVAPGTSCTISVTFAPTAGGNQTANLNVNATNTTSQTVLMSGTGSGATMTVAPSPTVAFGNVNVNTTKVLSVTVSNAASSPMNLLLAAPTITGSGRFDSQPTKYTFSSTCPVGGTGVAPGSSCTISVTFAPTATGNQTANLNVNATNTAAQTVLLSGTGVAPVLLTIPLNAVAFGNVASNATRTLGVTVSNVGNANLVLANPTIVGSARTDSQPAKYSFTTTCPIGGAGLAPLTTCSISVTFAPTATGNQTANLNVNASNANTRTLLLSGTGT